MDVSKKRPQPDFSGDFADGFVDVKYMIAIQTFDTSVKTLKEKFK